MKSPIQSERFVASIVVAAMLSACGVNQPVIAPKSLNPTKEASAPTASAPNASAPNASAPMSAPSTGGTKVASTQAGDGLIVIDTSGDDEKDRAHRESLDMKFAKFQAQAKNLQDAVIKTEKELLENRDMQGSFRIKAPTAIALFALGARHSLLLKNGGASWFKVDEVIPDFVDSDGFATNEITDADVEGIKKEWNAMATNAENRRPITINVKGERVTFKNAQDLSSFVDNQLSTEWVKRRVLERRKVARIESLAKVFYDERLLELTHLKNEGYALYLQKVTQAKITAGEINAAKRIKVRRANGRVAIYVGALSLVALGVGTHASYYWYLTREEANRLEFTVLPNLKSDLAAMQEQLRLARLELAKFNGESFDDFDNLMPNSDPITKGDLK